jgi:hypothetical protein
MLIAPLTVLSIRYPPVVYVNSPSHSLCLLHFKSQWAQICDAYIPDFPWGERPFKMRIVQIRFILILKNRIEVFSSETIDSNYTKVRNQIQFEF